MEAPFGPVEQWQAMLDRHHGVFADMLEGSSLGFVARDGAGVLPGKHLAALRQAGGAKGQAAMLTWEVRDSGMRADLRSFGGFEDARIDLLFVADDEALAALHDSLAGETLAVMKKLIRRGHLLFYVLKAKHQLQDAGYEDFLDSLGLAFLGACR